MSDSTSNTTTDHDVIRTWSEERGAVPAAVEGNGDSGRDPDAGC